MAALAYWLQVNVNIAGRHPSGPHVMSDEEMVAEFRDALVSGLSARGTAASVTAIEWLALQSRDATDWSFMIAAAKRAMRTATWKWPSPRDVIAMRPQTVAGEARIVVATATDDRDLLAELWTHLAPPRRRQGIEIWHEGLVGPGLERDKEVPARLEGAQVILLGVSAAFLDDDRCYVTYLRAATRRHESGTARLIPILLRACRWQESPLAKLQFVPKDGNAVTSQANRDEAWAEIVAEVSKVVDELAQAHLGEHG